MKEIFKKWYFWVITVLIFSSIILFLLFLFFRSKNEENNNSKNSMIFDPRVVKTFTAPSGTAFKYSSPMLYNEHIYIGTSERIGYADFTVEQGHDNFFYKFDLDFNVIWEYPFGKKMIAGGAVMDSNHNLYFVTELLDDKNQANKKEKIFSETYLTSLTEDGKFRWEKPIYSGDELWDHAYLTPAISKDDVIYLGQSKFYAFDTSGNILNTYPEDDRKFYGYSGAPAIDNEGNIYFTSPQAITYVKDLEKDNEPSTDVIKAYKFAPKLSSLIWATEIGNEIMDDEGGAEGGGRKSSGIESPVVLGVDGKVLYGVVGCTISKVDTKTGKLLWSLKPPLATGHFNASPAVDDNDNIYIGTKSNYESRFYAIRNDGTVIWDLLIGADLYNSPILGDDGLVYVGSEGIPEGLTDGKFHAIDMKTGEQKWAIGKKEEYKIPDFSHNTMLLYKGYVYVGVHSAMTSEDNVFAPTLYKIKVDANDYLKNSPWPRIYQGNDNDGRLD